MATEDAMPLEDQSPSRLKSGLLWAAVAALLTVIIDNQGAITSWLLAVSPDWLDPIVARAWELILSIIMLFVGPSRKSAKPKGY